MVERWVFLRELIRRFHTTGAVTPSGRRLGRALARFAAAGPHPKRILEIGPGTGAVTRCIVKAMGQADTLDVVEINEGFVRHLQARLTSDSDLATAASRIRIFHNDARNFAADAPYQVVISGLPLNNFDVDEADGVLRAMLRLVTPNGVISFFQYIGIRRAKRCFSGRAERERLDGIERLLEQFLAQREFSRDSVWLNVPPAWVHHLKGKG
jgi:phospholipid N-methyltransferase